MSLAYQRAEERVAPDGDGVASKGVKPTFVADVPYGMGVSSRSSTRRSSRTRGCEDAGPRTGRRHATSRGTGKMSISRTIIAI